MNILEFEKDSCQGCYKCIRHCEVKAITYKDNYASINIKDCVLCGECVNVCPTHAKHIKEDMNTVLDLINQEEYVIASLAPSFKAYFKNISFPKISYLLKKLGFKEVQETVIGASKVNNAYIPYIEEHQKRHLITSACYSTILLIEKHFPQLVDYLIPVDSPMMAHAKMIKDDNKKAKVVFIGPCVSKKAEAVNIINKGVIDAVLTFEDIEKWIEESNLDLNQEDDATLGVNDPRTRIYPINEGVIKSLDAPKPCHYEMIYVNGIDQVKHLFEQLVDDIEKNELPHLFIEAHICLHSCIGGPILRKKHIVPALTTNYFEGNVLPQDINVPSCVASNVDIYHPYFARTQDDLIPTEEDIQFILSQTGKFTKADEIDCGACGYATCREKAIAVFQKKADIDMCLPFFRKRAESLSNMITDHSPNAIFVLNELYEVQEFNYAAEVLFNLKKSETLNSVLPMFNRDGLLELASKQNSTIRKKLYYPENDKICQISVTYIAQHHLYLIIIIDISEMEAQKQAIIQMRQQTIDATSMVIEKQMRVAQEIASLLGETTAQTKVTLTKLKEIVSAEDESV